MKVEIYGIPEDVSKCSGCVSAVRLCFDRGYDYELIPVLKKTNNPLGFEYILEKFDECKVRANMQTRPTSFPRIFVDGNYIGSLKQFKELYGSD